MSQEKAEDSDYKNIMNKRNNHIIRLFRLFLSPRINYVLAVAMIAIIIIANITIALIIISVVQPEFDSREGDVFPSVLSIICKFSTPNTSHNLSAVIEAKFSGMVIPIFS